jgi:two-component system, OmpR family, phosphate regulon sensor histidine kinase PhoR
MFADISMLWPFLIFSALLLAILAQVWWRERRLRQERREATAEYMSTALAQQRDAYARAQAQLEALFNSMTEGVLVTDRKGSIQFHNRSFEQLFQTPGFLRGRTLKEMELHPELNKIAERLEAEKSVLGVEITLPGDPEQIIEVNAVTALDQKGEAQGVTFVFHDLTRLKQLEKTRQEFVANVSHELRTPLTLIKGFVETLIDGAHANPEVSMRFLRNIEKHADRLTFLIEDLLTISRLESRQVNLNFQEVEMSLLTKKVLDDLETRAAEKDMKLENQVPSPFLAQVDADRMQQVLYNLIENAIKYGRHGGYVIVGGREHSQSLLKMWVKDDGLGIPAESQPRIFERFYRVDRARSRETGGTGLGLSIVKHIVQAHGGEVRVESKLGEGATFFFTFPKA